MSQLLAINLFSRQIWWRTRITSPLVEKVNVNSGECLEIEAVCESDSVKGTSHLGSSLCFPSTTIRDSETSWHYGNDTMEVMSMTESPSQEGISEKSAGIVHSLVAAICYFTNLVSATVVISASSFSLGLGYYSSIMLNNKLPHNLSRVTNKNTRKKFSIACICREFQTNSLKMGKTRWFAQCRVDMIPRTCYIWFLVI